MKQGSEGRFRMLDEVLVHRGPVISVLAATLEVPDGTRVQREVVRHPGAVVVVPVAPPTALLVRQYRAAIGDYLLELPAGKRDVPGEPGEETARRELREEMGLQAERLTLAARFYNSPGFSDEMSLCYLAEGLTSTEAEPQGPEESDSTVVEVSLEEVSSLIASGRIVDAKTIIGLMLAREALE